MEKGLLKNKIITTLTLGFAVLTIHNLLFTASSSYHLFKQDYDKNHLQESDFACVQEYDEKMAYCDKEIERVTPIRKAFVIALGVSAAATAGAYAVMKIEDKKQRKIKEETDSYIGG